MSRDILEVAASPPRLLPGAAGSMASAYACLELVREQFVDGAMTIDPAHASESFGDHPHAKMCFAGPVEFDMVA
jgi:hypothetical protein